MMKRLKVLVTVILVSAFLMPISNTEYATANTVTENGKFDMLLLKELECGNADELSVFVVFNDFDEDTLNEAFEAMYPDEYKTCTDIYEGTAENLTYADVKAVTHAKRAAYSALYTEYNANCIAALSNQGVKVNTEFTSRYLPVCNMKLSKEDILKLGSIPEVHSVFFLPECKIENASLQTGIGTIDADTVRDSFGYTGEGVDVGMIDGGMPDINNAQFSGLSLTTDPYGDILATEKHSTAVATIIAGNTLGIAPDVNLYATSLEYASHLISRTEWLLDYDVCVINISMAMDSTNLSGYYDIYSRQIDAFVNTYNVSFCIASGNSYTSDKRVTSPGMAYNCITVGNFNDSNTTSGSDDVLYYTSRYSEMAQDVPRKPDLTAPGSNISFSNIPDGWLLYGGSGTSFATPMATATIAQLVEYDSALAIKPAEVKAILLAGASDKLDSTAFGASYSGGYLMMAEQEGAGKLNSLHSLDITDGILGTHSNGTILRKLQPSIPITYVNSNTTKRIVVCWNMKNYFDPDSGDLVSPGIKDVSLKLKDSSSGNIVATSNDFRGNVEILEGTYAAGSYRILIQCSLSALESQTYGMATYKK